MLHETKKTRILVKILGFFLFAVLTFINVKLLATKETEIARNDISVLGVKLSISNSVNAETDHCCIPAPNFICSTYYADYQDYKPGCFY